MKSKLLLICALAASSLTVKAAVVDTGKVVADPPLVISGSVDTYFKYDFAGKKIANIPTSFANEQNSLSLGMIDLGLKKTVGKATFVGELSFGPRSNGAIPLTSPSGSNTAYNIQNLYVSYNFTDKFNITGGYMATFVGYEVISPVGNFNYSTSYLFTNGPFQNAGVKLTYAFTDKVSLMAGIFNDAWNQYQSVNDMSTFGAQLMVAPVKGWTAYLNVVAGTFSGTEFDLTTTYQITDAFKLGLNAADFTAPEWAFGATGGAKGGFTGAALYPQYAVSKDVTLGLRGEYFKTKTGTFSGSSLPAPGESVTAFTLTANVKAGPLTFIPEVRLDNGSKTMFVDSKGVATKSASQVVVAAVYAF
ncbi:MAG: porin [Mucilaginibacter sp.]|uniref:porin n=1 Tax=Mucilaginibacter sp. TaxID=1882438 RepID=UPI00326496DD